MTDKEFKKLYEKEMDVVDGNINIIAKALLLPPPYYDLGDNGEGVEVSRERFLEIMLEVVATSLNCEVGNIFKKKERAGMTETTYSTDDMMKKGQIVKSPTLANILLTKGFQLVQIGQDNKNTHRLVFWFKNSVELQDEIKKYMDNQLKSERK